ncbi:hypothetical protein LTR78_005645 [Recurvomyces mirabilis]|uniref:Phosphoglucomutase n=1 Tax=Recurvomyces mirabilis TaxID=574656 RepID=A0AAE0WMV0_9PEZI|nr:hypothetical protein LTR78_005645 [Recurvomyces mirabilis]KAK5151232.1 hypothetical protein LTS14_009402 [Recurvomyces mirabilis]
MATISTTPGSMSSTSVQELAQKWLQQDRDPETRKEIQDLLSVGDDVALESRLRRRIAFGTAGLRSSMQAGYAHMNSLTVLQASQGLATYILGQQSSHSVPPQAVVMGYDARYNSEKFARLAAAAFIAKGLDVLWFGELVHTPMVPFAVEHFSAAAGVMITASHNPARDNGYKVYWANGCQIIPPRDKDIATAIDLETDILSWDHNAIETSSAVRNILAEARGAYKRAIQILARPAKHGNMLPFTYTPMHGVGLPFMQEAVEILGFTDHGMYVVAAQANPDADFPTVPFPNPEEKGALNLAMEEATASGSQLIIANDPDADRFAAAEYLDDGRWHQFTGNEMGALLAAYVLETSSVERDQMAMLASTVSSRMLQAIAEKEGFRFQSTLTGFKYLGNVAQQMRERGLKPVYAYEEAIGYMFPSVVWDKDGIAAATVFLLARRKWHAEGLTPWRKLQSLFEHYGYFADANTYLISPSPEVTSATFAAIRNSSHGTPPTHIGKRKVRRWRDLTTGYDSGSADGTPDLPVDTAAQMITCWLDDAVFTARGSGTEPKIKLYVEAIGAASSAAAKTIANDVLKDLVSEWFPGLRLAGI